MHKLKKMIALLLSTVMLTSFAACVNPSNSSSEGSNDGVSDSTQTSTSDNDSNEDSNSDSASDSSSDSDNDTDQPNPMWDIVDEAYTLGVGESLPGTHTLSGTVTQIDTPYNGSNVTLTFVVSGRENYPIYCYRLQGVGIDVVDVGDKVTVSGTIKNYKGTIEFDKNCLLVSYESTNTPPDDEQANDPYADVTASEFYANYAPARSNTDAYYRSLHGFMSGSIEVPDAAPTISDYQPTENGNLIRNSKMQLSADGKTYTVVNAYGNEAFKVFKDGAYITLEEVAAYVYAFGTYPKNHSASKNSSPSSSIWGKYLRLNHTVFSGNTSRYPYEPELPNITGCGGSLTYYEMDVGTTGTYTGHSTDGRAYNNGTSITRGAARIVYGKNDLDRDGVFELGEFHVFYTYNHYNDFQEYLNYEGGWGEIFGNITGGGTISSNYDYNPTEYEEISFTELPPLDYTPYAAFAFRAANNEAKSAAAYFA